jgi:hypothetical protein
VNHVLQHLLILWGVIGVVLGGVFLAKRLGVKFEGLKYAGIFGFVGAAFGVVIGMTTFFASEHYGTFRDTAQKEATALGDMAVMTGPFPVREGQLIREQIYCYATDVIEKEWTRTDGTGSQVIEGREGVVYRLLLAVGQSNPEPENWYSQAVRSSLDVGEARQDRLLLSQPRIPVMLWGLLYLGASLIVLFAFFFHLENSRQLVGMLAAVIVMLSAVTAVLAGLDSPTESPFGLKPHAMRAERALLAKDVGVAPEEAVPFCSKLPAVNFHLGPLQ